MHLQRPGVILVRILEFDTNGDVPRLKEAGFEKQEQDNKFFSIF